MLSSRKLTSRRCGVGLRFCIYLVRPSRRHHQSQALSREERHRCRLPADQKFCGTKKIKVALSDGWGGNYWRHITRAEFEDEASKCPNITETRYTDGEFKPEKQIADIEGLIAQKFDVIVAFLDTGPAILKATREATAAGIAVVPYSVGDNFPGVIGKDYVDRVTESQSQVGEQFADWLAKTLNGKGTVIMFGGTPGNPMTAAQVVGWKPTFAKYPGHQGAGSRAGADQLGSGHGAAEDRGADRQISRDRRHL